MLKLKNLIQIFVAFHVTIQIVMEMFEYYDHMLSEFETVENLNDSLFTFAITLL